MLTPYIERMQCISFKTSHDCVLIDLMCFDDPWTRDEFVAQLNHPRTFGRVVVGADGITVLGYIVYAIPGTEMEIVRMAVHPAHQGKGVGSAMVRRVLDRLEYGRSYTATAVVPEAAIGMQCCLRKAGFYGELSCDSGSIVFSRRS